MHVRRFGSFVDEETDTIAEYPQQRWHGQTSSAIYPMPLVPQLPLGVVFSEPA
jgi:hypothetical protein